MATGSEHDLVGLYAVGFGDGSDDLARHTTCYHTSGDILGDHCSCGNDGAFANGNASDNGDAGTEPHVVGQMDWLALSEGFSAPLMGMDGMTGTSQHTLGTNEDIFAYKDWRGVEKHTVEVDECETASGKVGVDAVVELDMGRNHHIGAPRAEELA